MVRVKTHWSGPGGQAGGPHGIAAAWHMGSMNRSIATASNGHRWCLWVYIYIFCGMRSLICDNDMCLKQCGMRWCVQTSKLVLCLYVSTFGMRIEPVLMWFVKTTSLLMMFLFNHDCLIIAFWLFILTPWKRSVEPNFAKVLFVIHKLGQMVIQFLFSCSFHNENEQASTAARLAKQKKAEPFGRMYTLSGNAVIAAWCHVWWSNVVFVPSLHICCSSDLIVVSPIGLKIHYLGMMVCFIFLQVKSKSTHFSPFFFFFLRCFFLFHPLPPYIRDDKTRNNLSTFDDG